MGATWARTSLLFIGCGCHMGARIYFAKHVDVTCWQGVLASCVCAASHEEVVVVVGIGSKSLWGHNNPKNGLIIAFIPMLTFGC